MKSNKYTFKKHNPQLSVGVLVMSVPSGHLDEACATQQGLKQFGMTK